MCRDKLHIRQTSYKTGFIYIKLKLLNISLYINCSKVLASKNIYCTINRTDKNIYNMV